MEEFLFNTLGVLWLCQNGGLAINASNTAVSNICLKLWLTFPTMIYASNQTPSETVFLAKCTFPRWPCALRDAGHFGGGSITTFNVWNKATPASNSYCETPRQMKRGWPHLPPDELCNNFNTWTSIWPTVLYSTLASSNLIQPDHTCYPSYPSINWWMYLWSHLFFYVYIQTYTKINKYENISYISYILDM